ncbi:MULTISPECIES: hypothetical protein [unclassified Streptomyces]|uniref:hypothetical protein n=1 Tax=unclassified Streptomyces TaxID=2593676 RepID=UPI00093F3FD5|nr:hypothetical protein [Streptomyces sp. CB02400]OKJ93667.1 hypothetical protein AMK33_32480 [Streptomyces sp. CB02400]
MTHHALTPARLLPWTGPEGKPCYLLTDGSGRLSRAADIAEGVQLDMAADLLAHLADMLHDEEHVSAVQLRYLLARMGEALTDVCRIAESRGARLCVYADLDAGTGPDG